MTLFHIPDDVRETQAARRRLNAMSPARRAQIEREWMAGEAINDRAFIEAELRSIVAHNTSGGQDV